MKGHKLSQILMGAGRLLDFSTSYNIELKRKYLKTNSAKIDRDALKSDWQKVGQTIKSAMENYQDKDTTRHNHA